MIQIHLASDGQAWEEFLTKQRYASFLQSWTMGDVYAEIGQEPIRVEARDEGKIVGICLAILVPARRGRHLMVQYGPVVDTRHKTQDTSAIVNALLDTLKILAKEKGCGFLRVSPFVPETLNYQLSTINSVPSPLHLLSEYTWYIPLTEEDRWAGETQDTRPKTQGRSAEAIRADMRKTTRNLIGRAEREGVTVTASTDPNKDLDIYFALQEETYKRHHFVPYRESFIRAQVKHFAPKGQAIVYIARYQGEPVAASVHMSYAGITSYHHGASTQKHAKIPASYLLQWTAISNALKRGDEIYNFWGIAPRKLQEDGSEVIIDKKHPFAGVTTFKTGFGGKPLPLVHCMDIPLSPTYRLTRVFEFVRKWRRGF